MAKHGTGGSEGQDNTKDGDWGKGRPIPKAEPKIPPPDKGKNK